MLTLLLFFLKKVESVLKMKKIKMALPSRGTAAGLVAVPRGPAARGALLPPYPTAAGT
jgi:hypothetical protein